MGASGGRTSQRPASPLVATVGVLEVRDRERRAGRRSSRRDERHDGADERRGRAADGDRVHVMEDTA